MENGSFSVKICYKQVNKAFCSVVIGRRIESNDEIPGKWTYISGNIPERKYFVESEIELLVEETANM